MNPEDLVEKYHSITENVKRATKDNERLSLQYGYEGTASLLNAIRCMWVYGIEYMYAICGDLISRK